MISKKVKKKINNLRSQYFIYLISKKKKHQKNRMELLAVKNFHTPQQFYKSYVYHLSI